MTLHYLINKPIEEVFQILSTMQLFVEAHPVVYKVKKYNEKNYQFYERLKFIPIPFSYPVSIENLERNKSIHLYSSIIKGVELQLFFSLTTINNQTAVEEIVRIKAPIIIKQVFQRIIKNAHKSLFNAIELKGFALTS